jgi:V8-like Glu-specific endopeptidase
VQLKITIPQSSFGKRVFTLDNVPSEVPKTSKKLPSAIERKLKKVRPDGVRPGYFPLSFIPQKVELKLSERAFPPFDFEYRRGEEILDRPTNVFAPDDRYIYQDTNFPWCTVGRVDTPLGFCTGCTIGPRLLLTANHNIQWNDDNTAGWVRFRPAYYNGSSPFGEAWATRVIYWRKTTPADGLSNSETAFDYVVCVLDTRIGDYIGYSGYRTYSDSWNGGSYWQHLGYPSDLSGGERPAFHGNASISSVEARSTSGQDGYVLGHFNDIVSGHSGGPVWGWWDGEPWPRVVGSQSTEARTPSMDTSGDNEFGGGPALSSLISWARSNYS